MKRIWFTMALAGSLATSAAVAQPGGPPRINLPTADQPLEFGAGPNAYRVALVTDGLVSPWDLEFLPDGSMLVTEIHGRLRLVRDGQLVEDVLWEVPPPGGRDVLHGVVAHPNFEENGFVYVSYTKNGDRGQTLAVTRGRLEGTTLVDAADIFVADAWENASNATAGRMIFGPDGTLYVSIGDRDRVCCGAVDDISIRIQAQDLGNHVGKVVRLTDDGGIPDDNPFIGRQGAKEDIFAYGLRNTYGFSFHPETGELWSIDIGPNGGDEVNILLPGRNYGWPLVSMGRNYSGTLASEFPYWRPGMENPRMFWMPQITPSSLAWYTGDKFPQWQNNLFVTALSGQQVQRIVFGSPGRDEQWNVMLDDMGVRFRDVVQGPDGYIYLTTEARYGGTNPVDAIVRLEPAAAAAPAQRPASRPAN